MATEMSGSLLSVTGSKAWKGGELTNGFLMKNADGRVAAITQSGTLDLTDNSAVTNAVPFGNGLVRLTAEANGKEINALKSGVPANALYQFAGIVKYEPGWAISHPVQNWGIPAFSKFTAITRGIVGFKFSKKLGQSDADYLAFIKGDKSKITAVDTFEDWMTLLAAATAVGSNLYLLIDVATGFPRVIAGGASIHAITPTAGHMLVGRAVVFEPENGMIGFEIDGDTVYGAADGTHYHITYNGNTSTGGTVPTDATAYSFDENATVAANTGTLVKTGYTFDGWNTAADGSGDDYAAGAIIEVRHDITLYAQWKAV